MKRLLLLASLLLVYASPATAQQGIAIGTCRVLSGSGSPESAVIGSICDQWLRTDTGTVYEKRSGTNTNTGWVLSSIAIGSDDQVPVSSGTAFVNTTVPNCTDSSGNHLNYTQATNSFSCGTTGDGVGGQIHRVLRPVDNEPPASNFATLDTRNSHPVLDFDDSTDEASVFSDVLPDTYASGGLTVTLVWAGTSATSGDVVWNVEIERVDAASLDIDSDSFASAQAATGTAPGTTGQVRYTNVTFTNGAQMDSLAAGELYRIRVTRDANNGSDTMAGDAELVIVLVKES